jgi:hypothetical protein
MVKSSRDKQTLFLVPEADPSSEDPLNAPESPFRRRNSLATVITLGRVLSKASSPSKERMAPTRTLVLCSRPISRGTLFAPGLRLLVVGTLFARTGDCEQSLVPEGILFAGGPASQVGTLFAGRRTHLSDGREQNSQLLRG